MLLSLVFYACSPILGGSQPIEIDAGYYSLQELCQEFSSQGVPITPSARCADDAFAIFLNGTSWPEVRSALESCGRLKVTMQGDEWNIDLDSKYVADSAEALDLYLAALGEAIDRSYGEVIRVSAKWPELGEKGIVDLIRAKLARESGLSLSERRVYSFVSLVLSDKDMMFYFASLPAQASGTAFKNATREFQFYILADRPELFTPSADPYEFELLRIVVPPGSDPTSETLRQVRLASLLQWDPLTNDIGHRVTVDFTAPYLTDILRTGGRPRPVAPNVAEVSFSSDLTARISNLGSSQIRALPESSPFAQPFNLPEQMVNTVSPRVTFTEVMLRCAEASGTNLIAYIPRIGDYVIPGNTSWHMFGALAAVNNREFDSSWITRLRRERSGIETHLDHRMLQLPLEVEAIDANGILVLSSTRRFMDELVNFPLRHRIDLANISLQRPPRAAEIFSSVASLNLNGIDGNLYPAEMLTYANPWALYPFAIAYSRNEHFRSLINEALAGDAQDIKFKELPQSLQTVLISGMKAVEDRTLYLPHYRESQPVEPVSSTVYIVREDTEPLLKIRPTADGLLIEIWDGRFFLWHANLLGTSEQMIAQ